VAGLGIAPGLSILGDMEPKAGTLSEIHVGMWEQEQLKEALQRVGRPGLNLGLLATVSTPAAIYECIRPGIREPNNTQIGMHILPEQKITWDRFLMAHFCQDRGINPWQSAMSLIGALCRNPQEAAVTLIANGLGELSYGRGPTMSFFSNLMDGTYGTREPNWAVATAMRASERNLRVITGTAVAGIKWRQITGMYQAAAQTVIYTACGFSYPWIAGHTGLEARMVGEIMECTAGMDRKKANALAQKIMEKAEAMLEKDGPGETRIPFGEAYDLKTVKPLPEFEAGLMAVKEDLASMGMPYK
jgi:methylamine--corrinoid protein Co-methyltransferase